MYRIQNIKSNFGKISYIGNYFNSFEILNLAKYDIYPQYQKDIMKNVSSHVYIQSGKLMINMKKYIKNTDNFKCQSLFAENNILYKTEEDHDLILTNQKYILTISPNVFYSFYSYDDNTNFQLFYKSNESIKYYTFYDKKYNISF